MPLAVLVIDLEPACPGERIELEIHGTTCNEHEVCVDSVGAAPGMFGTPKRAPRTDLLAVAVPHVCATALSA